MTTMSINRYKSDAVYSNIVLKSAFTANAVAFSINLLLAVNLIAESMAIGCSTIEERRMVLAAFVGIHVMVFIVVFGLMVGAFILMVKPDPK